MYSHHSSQFEVFFTLALLLTFSLGSQTADKEDGLPNEIDDHICGSVNDSTMNISHQVYPETSPSPTEDKTEEELTDYVLNGSQTERFLARDVSDFVCSRDGLCNKSLSHYGGLCTFECYKCQCDNRCHFYGDCCPDKTFGFEEDSFVEPNPYIACSKGSWTKWGNFTHIFMISLCPKHADETAAKKCENADVNIREEATPVTDERSGLPYRNVFCAQCHQVTNFVIWKHEVTCKIGSSIQRARSKAELWRMVVSDFQCSIHTIPPNLDVLRECDAPQIEKCNATGELTTSPDPMVTRLCGMYRQPVDYYGVSAFYKKYKNIFCAICNGAELKMDTLCIRQWAESGPPPLSMLLDFNPVRKRVELIPPRHDCATGTVFDPFLGSCKDVICPARKMLVDNSCEEIFTSVRGLAFSMQTVVRPHNVSRRIPRDFLAFRYMAMFSKELDNMKSSVFVSVKADFYVNNINTSDEYNTEIVTMDSKILFSAPNRTGEIEKRLIEIMSQNFSLWDNGVDITMLSQHSLCPTSYDGKEDYYKFKTDMFNAPQMWIDSLCERHNCISYIVYGPLDLTCPFVQINISSANFAVDVSKHTLLYGDLVLQLKPFRYMVCEGTFRICTDHLVDITNTIDGHLLEEQLRSNDAVMSLVSTICISVSLVGLFLTFLTYSILPKIRTLPGKITMQLVTHLFLAQLLFLTTSNRTANLALCQVFGVVGHYFWLSSFTWMFISAFHMHSIFTRLDAHLSKTDERRKFTQYFIACIIVPMLIISVCLAFHLVRSNGQESGYGGGSCFLNNPLAIGVFFAAPLGFALVVNAILFLRTVMAIRSLPDMTAASTKSSKNHVAVYIKLSLLFGFTWIFGILAAIFQSNVLWYSFNILSGSQGLYLFVAYCANKRVWNMFKEVFRAKEPRTQRSTQHTKTN